MTETMQAWNLVRRPDGVPVPEDFALRPADPGRPGEGEVLVRNTWLSVDPYMRGRMSGVRSYVDPYALDAPMDGGALGVVEVTGEGVTGVSVGDAVLHGLGWRTHAVVPASALRVVDLAQAPAEAYLGVLGMTGLTAYAGLFAVARLQPGETVFVSAAAGAVGSVAAQIAKLSGAGRVIGSAGGPEKVRLLTDELKLDAAIDYRAGDLAGQLAAAAPEGIDVYFDNVGGEHLEAAIGAFRRGGRAAVCGAISAYNATTPPSGPRNLSRLIQTRGRIEGFLVGDHGGLRDEFVAAVAPWVADGALVWRSTVTDGIGSAVDAFLAMMSGANTGKMLVRL